LALVQKKQAGVNDPALRIYHVDQGEPATEGKRPGWAAFLINLLIF
jgi:hypothetical protein